MTSPITKSGQNSGQMSGTVAKWLSGALLAGIVGGCGQPGEPGEQLGAEPIGQIQGAVSTDWSSPTSLCVQAHSSKNSGVGSSNTIHMGFVYSNKRYSCTISGGISDGEKKCCTPSYYSYTLWDMDSSGQVYMKVTDSSGGHSGDGLRFSQVWVVKGSSSEQRSNFNDVGGDVTCEGCFAGSSCNSCWIDSDGHSDAWLVYTGMSDGYTFSDNSDAF